MRARSKIKEDALTNRAVQEGQLLPEEKVYFDMIAGNICHGLVVGHSKGPSRISRGFLRVRLEHPATVRLGSPDGPTGVAQKGMIVHLPKDEKLDLVRDCEEDGDCAIFIVYELLPLITPLGDGSWLWSTNLRMKEVDRVVD